MTKKEMEKRIKTLEKNIHSLAANHWALKGALFLTPMSEETHDSMAGIKLKIFEWDKEE